MRYNNMLNLSLLQCMFKCKTSSHSRMAKLVCKLFYFYFTIWLFYLHRSLFFILKFLLWLNQIVKRLLGTLADHMHADCTHSHIPESHRFSPEHHDPSCGTPLNGADTLLTIHNVHSYKAQLHSSMRPLQADSSLQRKQLTLYDVTALTSVSYFSHPP